MKLIEGKVVAAKIRQELAQEVEAFGRHPRLNVLLVGDDAASRLYVDLKQQAGKEAGVDVFVDQHPATCSQSELETLIDVWNADKSIDGILIQLPLPTGFDTDALIKRIHINKDADGFHPDNPNVVSPLHEGILLLIAQTPLKLSGAQGVILANSDAFARPLEKLLSTGGVSIEVMRPDEIDKNLLGEADLVISAIGRPQFIPASFVKDGAVLIDVGTTRENGKTYGDFDRESIEKTDCYLTPVPGGVGPMTVALLLKNVLRLAKLS
jgi:methylenetetrahydrofolate dehydrogenase (NADP+)/methenyltetrahydrofolate cyclohydrolase